MPKKERRALRVNRAVIKDLIFQQAGTREKAVLEGVMNSVDAGATHIDITVNLESLVIKDDGHGFPTKQKIIDHFEEFANPHEDGDAVYGRYRMGRGQLFAFGVNTWRSSKFEMLVDAKRDLDYDLTEDLPKVKGTTVTVQWYDPLSHWSLDNLIREIGKFVKYVSVPVVVNGEQVSVDPATQKWDIETDDYYIKMKETGGLAIYNLGVFVMDVAGWKYGTGGTVVSKRRLNVNFARNDVIESDPLWKRIVKDLRGEAAQKATRQVQRALTDDERQFFIDSLRNGELEVGTSTKLKLITDVTGRNWAPEEIVRWVRKHGIQSITVADLNDMKGDKLMQHETAFVLAKQTLERFHVDTVQQFLEVLAQQRISLGTLQPESFARLASHLLGDYVTVPESKWTPTERAIVANLYSGSDLRNILARLYPGKGPYFSSTSMRRIMIGESDLADAWTDGNRTIWLNRKFLKRVGTGLEGWMKIALTMLHEYCHDDSTMESHVHGPDFYRNFHDLQGQVADWAGHLISHYQNTLRTQERRVARDVLKMSDKILTIYREENRLDTLLDKRTQVETIAKEVKETRKKLGY